MGRRLGARLQAVEREGGFAEDFVAECLGLRSHGLGEGSEVLLPSPEAHTTRPVGSVHQAIRAKGRDEVLNPGPANGRAARDGGGVAEQGAEFDVNVGGVGELDDGFAPGVEVFGAPGGPAEMGEREARLGKRFGESKGGSETRGFDRETAADSLAGSIEVSSDHNAAEGGLALPAVPSRGCSRAKDAAQERMGRGQGEEPVDFGGVIEKRSSHTVVEAVAGENCLQLGGRKIAVHVGGEVRQPRIAKAAAVDESYGSVDAHESKV